MKRYVPTGAEVVALVDALPAFTRWQCAPLLGLSSPRIVDARTGEPPSMDDLLRPENLVAMRTGAGLSFWRHVARHAGMRELMPETAEERESLLDAIGRALVELPARARERERRGSEKLARQASLLGRG